MVSEDNQCLLFTLLFSLISNQLPRVAWILQTQVTFTCSSSAIETLRKGVKSVQS